MMVKTGLLITYDREDDAAETVKRLNAELRHRQLADEYYVHYLTHRLRHSVTYAVYCRRRKGDNQ